MPPPTPVDTSSFTPAQLAAFNNAAKLSVGGSWSQNGNTETFSSKMATPTPTVSPTGAGGGSSYQPPTNAQGVNTGAAPAGSKQSANGNWVDNAGNQYTQAPAGGSVSGGGTSGAGNGQNGATGAPGTVGPDATYGAAMGALSPGAVPSEADFYSQVYDQLSPVISAINSAETASETAAYAAGTKESVSLAGEYGARGLAGGSEAAKLAGQVGLDTAGAIAQAKQAQAAALTTAYKFLTSTAWSEFTNARDNNQALSANYVQQMQSTALATVKGLAESGITSAQDLQSKDPQAYLHLLQYYQGDPSALSAALALNQPSNNIVQSWTNGSTYYQMVVDPITKKPTIQSIDTGVPLPNGWLQTKVGTYGVVFTDPTNPANNISYTVNPFTGEIAAKGSGTMAGINKTSGGNTNTQNTQTQQNQETASTTVSTLLGVSPTTPLSDVISKNGLGSIVAAIVKNEGGSLPGVQNNPGNIKYTGAPGQTDSGVKAADGGTFANYATPQAGEEAIGNLINSAASGSNPDYGANPTLQSFVDKYTNTGSSSSDTGTNGLPMGQYGLLANVPGFNPSTPGPDQAAYNYLNEYLSGQVPSPSSVGLSTRSGQGAAFNTVAARAREVYQQATGQALPNQTELKGNLKLIVGNNSLANKLMVQEQTIGANFGLNLKNLTASNVNQNVPLLNSIIDNVTNALGDPSVAQYLAQNSTLQNEISSLLAVKNASGTTVGDKIASSGLLPSNASAAQQAQVYRTLMQEAENANTAVQLSNIHLYQQTDPLQLDPGNPLNNPITLQDLQTGETRTFQKGSLSATDLQDALSSGYVMTQ